MRILECTPIAMASRVRWVGGVGMWFSTAAIDSIAPVTSELQRCSKHNDEEQSRTGCVHPKIIRTFRSCPTSAPGTRSLRERAKG